MQDYLIETDQLGIRDIEDQDLDTILALATQPQTSEIAPSRCFDFEFVHSRKDTKTLVRDVWQQVSSQPDYRRYALVLKRDELVIGLCGILSPQDEIGGGIEFRLRTKLEIQKQLEITKLIEGSALYQQQNAQIDT